MATPAPAAAGDGASAFATGDLPFNENLLLEVMSYLSPRSLLRCGTVNRTLATHACADFLWEPLTALLWHNKNPAATDIKDAGAEKGAKIAPRRFPFRKVLLSEAACFTLSAAELKYLLRARGVRLAGCFEKKDFVRKLLTSAAAGACAPLAPPRSFSAKWRASFYMSLRDGRREKAIADDIIRYKWRMYFKMHQMQSEREWVTTFGRDGSVSSLVGDQDPSPGMNMRWTFWRLAAGSQGEPANDEGFAIRVGQYPPLQLTRLPCWGWRMENIHVFFVRTTEPSGQGVGVG